MAQRSYPVYLLSFSVTHLHKYTIENLNYTIEPREKRLVYFSLVQLNFEYEKSVYDDNKKAVEKFISLRCYVNDYKKVLSEPLFKK